MNILVADDDIKILRLISDFLKHENYNIFEAHDGQEALDIFNKEEISLLILDVMMPRIDGWEVCRQIREKSDVPILILTAKDTDTDELFGFDIGANEYISKPFNPMLLVARVKNLLSRFYVSKDVLSYSGIVLDKSSHNIKIDDDFVELTPKEFELLKLFLENISKTFKREYLLDYVWGYDYVGDERTVDTHITRLRKKLGQKSDLLKTVRGFGYKFEK